MKNKKRYILIFLPIILILFLGYQYLNNKKDKTSKENSIPVSIIDWVSYNSEYGFSFMHPIDTKVKMETKKDILKVADIVLKIEKLNCINPAPSRNISSDFKFYNFKAEIIENEKIAYICNNTNTACLDIKTQKTKMTKNFFHAFISSLNINKSFDEISCIK